MALPGVLRAAPLNQCNIIVADSQGTVYLCDAQAGERIILAQGGILDRPYKLARDLKGNIVVTDTGTLRVALINPATGQQAILAQGPNILGVPYGLAVDRHGLIYVANSQAIVLINPATSGVEIFAEGQLLRVPLDVAVAPDGNIYVADALAGVIRIDPRTKKQTLVASGQALHTPTGIAVDLNHRLYVVNAGNRCVVAVDARDGSQHVVSEAGWLQTPVGIAVGPGGTLLVSDPDAFELDGGIFSIDGDGTQTPVARGSDDLVNPRGILLVPASSK